MKIILSFLIIAASFFSCYSEEFIEKDDEKIKKFEIKILSAVKSGKISKSDGDELLKLRRALKKLSDEIWADGSMSEEERLRFQDASKEFKKRHRKIMPKSKSKKKRELPPEKK